MSLAELLPVIRALPHDDKLRLKQVLDEILAEEKIEPLLPPGEYEIWSPFVSYEAAYLLQKVLEQEKEKICKQNDVAASKG